MAAAGSSVKNTIYRRVFACCVANAFCALRFETRQSAKPWNVPAHARLRFGGLRLRFGGHSKVARHGLLDASMEICAQAS